ncbi:MAG: sugar ABC transporter substrate-binding protein, partial [Anaerolineae bacterium]|nr:sugar ABC transporter substrate-binding protein [Anaerolineae bacterium]
MQIKRVASLVALGLISLASFAVQAQSVDIAVLLPDSASSARWENDDRRFLAAAFEAAGVSYTIVNAEGSATTQITQA